MKNLNLMRKQLERRLTLWRKTPERPSKGWVRTLRQAFGMTAQQLAKRSGVHRMRIVQLEKGEANDAVTLRSLRSIARHMNCDLVYALVPRNSIQATLEHQAMKIAQKRVRQVAHSMALENQALSQKQIKGQIKDLTKNLLTGNPKHLWDE